MDDSPQWGDGSDPPIIRQHCSIGQVFTGVRNKIAVALAPSLEAIANAFVALASSTSPISRAFDSLLANLDRLVIYAGTFATFLAGRWVAAMAVAALSVRELATTLVILKGALIRTGIGALIVGAGELVYWFTRLASGAGGFGAAMGLLKGCCCRGLGADQDGPLGCRRACHGDVL